LLSSVGLSWAKYIHFGVMLLIFVVGAELVLRGAVLLFVPYPPLDIRRSVADSNISRALLRLSVPNFRTINSSVRNTLGIDLSRSWALAFVRQAALPVLAILGIFSWCITGVTGLAANQRGIYERLGAPVAVLGPGVHLHLPWPFGSVRVAENGVIHLLPIEFVLPGGEAEEHHSAGPTDAEGTPPEEADRLWSDDHPFEGSYLIAHEVDGKQSFQLVDVDMTVIYRIGLSDEAVRNATYRIANPDELIQAISGQLITRYFGRHTLLSVIGASRQAFTDEFQKDLQAELDKANSGIEAISVSIEAVHPPPGAAGAYHRVQSAGINANTEIFTSKGNATRQLSEAQLAADAEHNASLATADEMIANAKTESTLFEADRKAYGIAGRGFLLERWLGNLSKALDKSVPVILLDHRLQGENAPTVDLRAPSGAGATIVPGASIEAPDHVE
jgi:regulator of protease activity HflC (stomatin/prohibitin superfamily)